MKTKKKREIRQRREKRRDEIGCCSPANGRRESSVVQRMKLWAYKGSSPLFFFPFFFVSVFLFHFLQILGSSDVP